MSKWELEADNERLRDRLDRRDEDIADLQKIIETREARIEELEAALKPFAEATRMLSEHEPDASLVVGWTGMRGDHRLDHGNFRRATAALASEKNQ